MTQGYGSRWARGSVVAVALTAVSACGGDSSGGTPDAGGPNVPSTYTFAARFPDAGATSSVSYGGQTARHLLIADMKARIGQLQSQVASGSWTDPLDPAPTDADSLYAALDVYFRNGAGTTPNIDARTLLLTTTPTRIQSTYGAFGTARRLSDKIAGQDAANTYYVDWATSFVGFAAATSFPGSHGTAPIEGWNPTALVDAFLGAVSAQAYGDYSGSPRQVSSGGSMIDLPIFVDAAGRDYQQLLEKFLIGSVAFSQAADDYLDADARPAGGLNAPNTQDGANAYTVLEHAWDEGFGYFGASRDYGLLTDTQIAARVFDTNADAMLDLGAEYSFGWSANAASRDLGACPSSATDYTGTIMNAFLRGRAIIAAAGETLTTEERAALEAERDAAVSAWERVIAASAISYVNDLVNTDYATTTNLNFLDVAKHWSELKGFALSLQFNPRSPFAHTSAAPNANFVMLHQLIGDAPVLESAGATAITDYRDDLIAARTLLQNAYGFAAANVQGDGASCAGW